MKLDRYSININIFKSYNKEKAMNNKLFIMGLALFGVINVQAYAGKTYADKFIKFKTMELYHKTDWFDHMKRIHDTKYDLLKKQTKDWVAYSNENSRDWQNNTNCLEDAKDVIFARHLEKAIILHKKHNAQFKNLCDKLHREALAIEKRHEQELSRFEQNM
jgi:hypothetical protein